MARGGAGLAARQNFCSSNGSLDHRKKGTGKWADSEVLLQELQGVTPNTSKALTKRPAAQLQPNSSSTKDMEKESPFCWTQDKALNWKW